MAAGGMFGVFVDSLDFSLCVVRPELSSNHFDIRVRRCVAAEGIRRRVHTNEGFTRFYPVQESLFVRQEQIASGVGENDTVIVLKSGGTHLFRENLLDGGIYFVGIGFAIFSFELGIGRFDPSVIDGEGAAFFSELRQDLFSGGRDRAK